MRHSYRQTEQLSFRMVIAFCTSRSCSDLSARDVCSETLPRLFCRFVQDNRIRDFIPRYYELYQDLERKIRENTYGRCSDPGIRTFLYLHAVPWSLPTCYSPKDPRLYSIVLTENDIMRGTT